MVQRGWVIFFNILQLTSNRTQVPSLPGSFPNRIKCFLFRSAYCFIHISDGVITDLEPDILECEVKCLEMCLESITMNKASGGDGIPVELFRILKDDAVKCCTQYASKLGKLSSGHRTGKGPFSFQPQRKAMPKNVRTTTQLHSSHTLVK